MLLIQFQASPPSLAVTAPAGTLSSTQATSPPLLTTCDKAGLAEPELPASPAYEATMLCVPALRLLVLHVVILLLAVPVGRATAVQPARVLPSAVKVTLPVGALPLTVAVNVTFAPRTDGLPEPVRPVVLAACPPPMLTVTLSALEVALLTVTWIP